MLIIIYFLIYYFNLLKFTRIRLYFYFSKYIFENIMQIILIPEDLLFFKNTLLINYLISPFHHHLITLILTMRAHQFTL